MTYEFNNDDERRRASQYLRAVEPVGKLHQVEPRFRHQGAGLFVRLDFPGVLRVFDADSGELLAESEPGRPGEVAAGFVPPRR